MTNPLFIRFIVVVCLLATSVRRLPADEPGANTPTLVSKQVDSAADERMSTVTTSPDDAVETDARAANGRADTPTVATVEEIAERAKPSIVVVSFTDHEGRQQGLGTGFVVSADGLIATNMHVIREARPIRVEMVDGTRYDVTEIHATERDMDLAVLRVDAQNLVPLALGDSDTLKQGQDLVAIGHPRDLKFSVVSGVLSGRREIDGRPMLQLAIPVETGNSGGPVLDRQGNVHGMITLKSAVTANLGFAVAVNALKPLLRSPNPIPMQTWLRIGALDPKRWTQKFGGLWTQRAGKILVEGRGRGIGRRTLCLSETMPPELPYEVAVSVKLDDEAGAAGLVIHSDGNDRHYGFYPSGGQLRFSRFDGPDVYSWQVLEQVRTPYYKPGDWNQLKVRVEADRIQCYVNDRLVIESSDVRYQSGQVGLAQFRETEAAFRSFQVARELPHLRPDAAAIKNIVERTKEITPTRPPAQDLIEELESGEQSTLLVLRERAAHLEQQAERLRQLAVAIHQARTQSQLVAALDQSTGKADLFRAALLVAQLDNEDLDIAFYEQQLEAFVSGARDKLSEKATADEQLTALNDHFFKHLGFHGARLDYYSRTNSYLNEVMDDRKGLPITLSLLYMEMARRLELNVVGVGLPGHFVVRYEPQGGMPRLIDVFDGGATLLPADAEKQVRAATGRPMNEEDLQASSKTAIIIRMLHNLFGVARDQGDLEAMHRYVDTIIALDPDATEPGTATDRWLRAVLNFQTDRLPEARSDVEWLLERHPAEINVLHVEQLQRALDAAPQ